MTIFNDKSTAIQTIKMEEVIRPGPIRCKVSLIIELNITLRIKTMDT